MLDGKSLLGMTLLGMLLLGQKTASQDYCSVNTYPTNGAVEQVAFSKELSQAEFASVGNFKSLHCCAHDFRTIEWFKGGKPYPWTSNVSSLMINPASHNQTIYSQAVSQADSGDYHCVVSYGTHQLKHYVTLTVTSFGFVGPPKATYTPNTQYHQLGETARFYCEGYVGSIQLPDARSEVVWTRHQDNFTEDANERHNYTLVSREDNQIYGSYLTITNLQPEDFGTYYCTVSNTGDQFLQLSTHLYENKEDWENQFDATVRVCLGVAFACISTVIILATTYRFRLQIRLLWKIIRRQFYMDEDEEVDVTLLYHEKDAATALTYIAPSLQQTFLYSCNFCELSSDFQLRKLDVSGKRLLVIFSRHLTQDSWSTKSVSDALQAFLKLHPKVICIFLEEMPTVDIKTEEGRSLKEDLARVHYITQAEVKDANFWTILQLGMPHPKKARSCKTADSLENLM